MRPVPRFPRPATRSPSPRRTASCSSCSRRSSSSCTARAAVTTLLVHGGVRLRPLRRDRVRRPHPHGVRGRRYPIALIQSPSATPSVGYVSVVGAPCRPSRVVEVPSPFSHPLFSPPPSRVSALTPSIPPLRNQCAYLDEGLAVGRRCRRAFEDFQHRRQRIARPGRHGPCGSSTSPRTFETSRSQSRSSIGLSGALC